MSLNPRNINNLQLVCSRKFCTIKDVQAESVLTMVLTLVANYLHSDPGIKTKEIEVDGVLETDKLKIKNFMQELFEYLASTVTPYTKIQEAIALSSRSPIDHMRARHLEPYGFYYNELATAFIDRLDYVSKKEESQAYIPDMLAIFLILDYKEKAGYSFEKYDFIFNADLEGYARFYFEANRKESQKKGLSFRTQIQDQTVIKKMSSMSLYMIDKLLQSNYSKEVRKTDARVKNQRRRVKRNKK